MIRPALTILMVCALAFGAASPAAGAEAAAPNVWKHYTVQSPSTGKIERFWVGHAARLKSDGRYPVIYFLPGLLDDEEDWKGALDTHLAKHDLIAVCPAVGGATWFMNSPAQPWMRWGDFLTDDLRAFVESHYPASGEKGRRGIVGISAGGHAAFYHAVRRPDLYGSVSVLSGAMDLRGYIGSAGLDYWIGPRSPETLPLYAERSCLALAERLEGPPPFALFLDAGDKDGALPQMETLRKILDAKRVAYRWNVGAGAHSWAYWTGRAADHLAWHAEQFEKNRRESRYSETAPAKAAPLEVLKGLPDVALSEETVRRLRAPWTDAPGLRPLAVSGLPPAGAPLSTKDEKYKTAKFTAALTAAGHQTGLYVYRMTLKVASPLPQEGTISLACDIRNGRRLSLLWLPPVALPVAAGEAQRRIDLRARVAVELKPPDPLRGGVLFAVQVFDADGKPLGNPFVAKAGPGTDNVERWTVAPQVQTEWILSLAGAKALPLAAIHDVRLQVEPTGNAVIGGATGGLSASDWSALVRAALADKPPVAPVHRN